MNASKLAISSQTVSNNLTDGYVKFQLNQHIYAVLSLQHTLELITVSVDSVTSMPNMPSCILGLMNWQSTIVWVIDLPKMLGIESTKNRIRQYNVIILRTESALLGLVVPEIKGTVRFTPETIQFSPEQAPAYLIPYILGSVRQERELLFVLDAQAIVQSSAFHSK